MRGESGRCKRIYLSILEKRRHQMAVSYTHLPELRNEGYEFKSLQYLMTQDSPVIIE